MCFLTPMYQASKYCEEQLKHAKNEGIPVIGILFLPNWKPSGWLSMYIDHYFLICYYQLSLIDKIQNELFLIDLREFN